MDLSISRNGLLRFIFIPLTVIIASLYFFPFEFSFAIGINTKMAMAGFGILLFCLQSARRRGLNIDKNMFHILIWALIVSFCGVVSIYYNGTGDFAYVTYIISMLVWLSAANVVVSCIRTVHGYISVELVCKYLIAVCCFQCLSALLIDNYEYIRTIVNTYIANFSSSVSSGKSLDDAGRLYGVGAALDIAGSRFSAVLVMIAFCTYNIKNSWKQLLVLLFSFVFILIIGSAISRTTIVGAILAILYWMVSSVVLKKPKFVNKKFGLYLFFLLVVVVPIIIYLYRNNANFHSSMRFAFEGIFNLFETGEFRTNSTDTLASMYVFPESIKTWLIGDGYFADPIYSDPYFTGISYSAFYKGIDVGYLRFIYYFGVLGLLAFVIYFMKVVKTCVVYFPYYKLMFLFVVAVNFMVWFKVSTDIFLVFAPFLCIGREESNAAEERAALNEVVR